MKYNTVAEIREKYDSLIAEQLEHQEVIMELGNKYPHSVAAIKERLSDIKAELYDLDDQEFELTGTPGWINYANEIKENNK